MINIVNLLGTSQVNDNRKYKNSKIGTRAKKERESHKIRKKMSVELFLRNILGAHLLEKKF